MLSRLCWVWWSSCVPACRPLCAARSTSPGGSGAADATLCHGATPPGAFTVIGGPVRPALPFPRREDPERGDVEAVAVALVVLTDLDAAGAAEAVAPPETAQVPDRPRCSSVRRPCRWGRRHGQGVPQTPDAAPGDSRCPRHGQDDAGRSAAARTP